MASLSTCHLGLWLGWQILLNLVKSLRGKIGYTFGWTELSALNHDHARRIPQADREGEEKRTENVDICHCVLLYLLDSQQDIHYHVYARHYIPFRYNLSVHRHSGIHQLLYRSYHLHRHVQGLQEGSGSVVEVRMMMLLIVRC